MLSSAGYVNTTRRAESQWVSKSWPTELCHSSPGSDYTDSGSPYILGHYVPDGPRSSWTKAQYTIYKEEQAAWRRNRKATRSRGLARMLRDGPPPDCEVGRSMTSLPSRQVVKIVGVIPAAFGIQSSTPRVLVQVEQGLETEKSNHSRLNNCVDPEPSLTDTTKTSESFEGTSRHIPLIQSRLF